MHSTLKTITDTVALVVFFPVGVLLFVCIVLVSVMRVLIQFSIAVVSDLITYVSSFPDKEK